MASIASKSALPSSSSSRRPTPESRSKGKHRDSSSDASPADARKKAEDSIRRRLALLANVPHPLSPTLPPSPPLSPRPPKRKTPESDRPSLPSEQPQQPKRPRISPHSDSISSLSSMRLKPEDTSSPENTSQPKEDGELEEPHPSQGPKKPLPPPRPLRRLAPEQMASTANRLLLAARELKHSGDKRAHAAPTSRRNILRLLEHTDALLHFIYAFWCQDECRATTTDPWITLEGFASTIRSSWEKLMTSNEATPDQVSMARIFFGLTLLLKYCAEHRTNRSHSRRLRAESVPLAPTNGAGSSSVSPANTASSHPTPPSTTTTMSTPLPPHMAPSPAASSSSSGNHAQPHMNLTRGHTSNSQSPPQQVSVSPTFVARVHKTLNTAAELQNLLNQANRYLNLFDMRKYFPRTFDVCAGGNAATGRPLSAGVPQDTHQVDFDACLRGEGEWAWPVLSGEDVVHAVGLGRSLVWEMGSIVLQQDGGYRGLAGNSKDGPQKK